MACPHQANKGGPTEIAHLYDSEERQLYLFRHPHSLKIKPRLRKAGGHDFCEIMYIADGRGTITMGNKSYTVRIINEQNREASQLLQSNAGVRQATAYIQAHLHEEMTPEEIAESVGFHDVPYFCRTFKKETNLTPLQYRRQN